MESPPIRLLPETLVNRIAAGEVIERPAAAVKELVENAIDAGAGRITVAITGGGVDRIEVADDGRGMTQAELPLAMLRHATSKLADETLVRIATLGFRGEALPSIGSAARLSITSRTARCDSAHVITVDGGAIGPVAPAAGPTGTRVLVRDLFFATPARRKFLKSARTEADHAEQALRRLALAAPEIAFRFTIDERCVFDLPPQTRLQRTAALFGPEAAAFLLTVGHAHGAISVSGYAAGPAHTRATAAAQGLVVNGRPVSDPVLKTAIRVAYRDVIAAGRHPVVALFLDLPAEALDVNVHPAKTELRFQDAAGVRGLVISALSRALASGAAGMAPRAAPRPPLRLVGGTQAWRSPIWRDTPSGAGGFAEPASLPFDQGQIAPAARVLPDAVRDAAPDPDHPLGAPVAQVLDTYVIAVAADGALVLVDQHAAHERLTHEAISAELRAGGVRAQPLLLPAVVDLAPLDAARLAVRAPDLARLGLELEAFGAGAILVRALPAVLGAPDPAGLVRDLADELAELGEAVALDTLIDAAVARLACHGSIRAGRRLDAAEMAALLRQMEATPRASTCSHGRPTFLRLTRAEIERMFGRR